jgi:hypothetical protein
MFYPKSGRHSIVEYLTLIVPPCTADTIGILIVRMHHIILKLIAYVEKNKNSTCETHGQPKHIQYRKKLLSLEIAKRDQ